MELHSLETTDSLPQQTYMHAAIKQAREELTPFGCVIVTEGRIIARTANRVEAFCDPTAHAELLAIRIACQHLNRTDLKGCTIYSTAEPCPMCMSAALWAGVSSVVYGVSMGQIRSRHPQIEIQSAEIVSRAPHDCSILPLFMNDECLRLFESM